MRLSGIVVTTSEHYFATTITNLAACEGVQVHYCDEESSRIIVTQEAPNTEEEVKGLRRIKALPHVVMAEMVYHYCED